MAMKTMIWRHSATSSPNGDISARVNRAMAAIFGAAAKKAVTAPMMTTKSLAWGANSNIGDSRATMKTPAVTMVAA